MHEIYKSNIEKSEREIESAYARTEEDGIQVEEEEKKIS